MSISEGVQTKEIVLRSANPRRKLVGGSVSRGVDGWYGNLTPLRPSRHRYG